MKAIQLLTIISLLLLVIACVPPAEELANITKEENKTTEPEVEVKQEITVVPAVPENKTAVIVNNTNTTNTTTAAQTPPQIANKTIVYTGGVIEMGEGESAKIIIQ